MKLNRRQLTMTARAYVVGAALMSIAFLLSGPTARSLIAASMMLAVVPAGFIARRVHGFPRVFTAGLATVGALYVLEAITAEFWPSAIGGTLPDSIDLLATFVIIVLAVFLVSRRRGGLTAGDVLDGLIIGAGAWLVSWILFVEPFVGHADNSTAAVVVNGLYLPTAVPLIVLAAMTLFGGGRPRPAAVALSAGLLFNVTGDVLYALDDVRNLGAWSYTAADVLYILSVAICGYAFVHPTAPVLVGRHENHRYVALPGRLSAVVVCQTVPLGLVTLVSAATPLDRVVRTVSAFAILGLVAVRLYTSARSQVRAQERLARAARTDELTDLPNKRSLLETTADSIDDLWESGRRPSLYLFDLDGFKNINDSLGHDVGDDLLVHIARRLESAATSIGATASRPSGDEFVVFDPTPTNESQALHHAAILRAIFREVFETIGGKLIVTASCGVSSMAAGKPTDAAELF
ncbi:MAG: GGDEF domain-containing protein, partial [Ilumatobacter sp.]|uniref:diguanylate cyclase domain-containing protein n=1 Tax=Ilumatobacter sp. TaxID=1967498 RepID=UPI003C75CE93